MKTPITESYANHAYRWDSKRGSYQPVGIMVDANLARRLELDRAALMEALNRIDQWPDEPIEDSRHDGSVYGEISVGDMRAIRAALSAARANFPDED